jgi:hypothetical protein
MSLFCNRSHSFSPSQKAIYVYVLPYQFPFWEAGHKIIEPPPTIPFLYPQKKDLAIPSYRVTCLLLKLRYGVHYKLIWHDVDNIITPLHALPPPCLHFPSQPPPAASRRWPLLQANLATTCAFFLCRQFQALCLQLQLVSINHHCQQRLLHQTPPPQNEDCCTCSKAC